jgi:hypothetical protein
MASKEESDRVFPDSFVRALDDVHDVQVRLNHVESLLRDTDHARDRRRDAKEHEKAAQDRLRTSRAELLERLSRVDRAREERAKSASESSSLSARVARRPISAVPNLGIKYPFGCAPSEGAVATHPPTTMTRGRPGA